MRGLPHEAAYQPPDIADGANQIILQPHFWLAAIAGAPQPVAADQLALRAFDAVAAMHFLLEGLGLHFPAAGLQEAVMFSDHEGAMGLGGADTLRAPGAGAAAGVVPLEAKIDPARLGLLQAAALRAGMAGWADGGPGDIQSRPKGTGVDS